MASSSDNRNWDIKPKDAKQALAEDKFEDCMSCKVMGSGAFIGLGVYSYYTGMNNLRKQEKAIMQSPTKYKMGSRRLGIATISASLIGAGIWRAFN
ncbi:uncharacterized protein N7469_007973 [Penicillium citrinum]|uniref:Distal membrane-arm assembly complex protein 1-like domain-containing protein n=2 Tax=Penicillium TaxID=5073 RepID=A0A9W9NQV5_PENCI|nr:uncharacterized protein N7469_007973 [Penicillium citrinum]KAJ5224470.1 hypothetical protein N7469_007973 [Penicillium citrinum]KAJ5574722.1 hypothetical protein N7450_008621 [Penicillium hetheringtonii]